MPMDTPEQAKVRLEEMYQHALNAAQSCNGHKLMAVMETIGRDLDKIPPKPEFGRSDLQQTITKITNLRSTVPGMLNNYCGCKLSK